MKKYLKQIKNYFTNKQTVKSENLIEMKVKNVKFPIYLRKETSDIPTYSQIFVENEYKLKNKTAPKIIVDGGANIGLFAVLMKNLYPTVKIICVEPDKENFQMLKKNLEFYDDVYFENCGIWNKDTKLKVYDKYQMGKWAMVVEEDLQNGDIVAISMNTLMQKYNLSHIDFLKLDVETSEKQIFANNYENWLPKIKTIIIEIHDWMEEGCSKPFFEAINKTFQNYKYYTNGENTVIENHSSDEW